MAIMSECSVNKISFEFLTLKMFFLTLGSSLKLEHLFHIYHSSFPSTSAYAYLCALGFASMDKACTRLVSAYQIFHLLLARRNGQDVPVVIHVYWTMRNVFIVEKTQAVFVKDSEIHYRNRISECGVKWFANHEPVTALCKPTLWVLKLLQMSVPCCYS